jgi:diguanylate cyclase (GGDEF)-like protein
LRSIEIICRYGGDEFTVILPHTNGAEAAIAAKKLCEKVKTEFAQDNITLSIGVAEFQTNGTQEIFIEHADQALYQAKQSGRNSVHVFRESLT